jgi:glycerol-3-phosphate dehydrogenase (NAD(P)+)
MPTTVVCASRDTESSAVVQELLSTPSFRVYSSTDVVGVEIGGALKNVIAIAAGLVDGVGLGDNTKAALITRGLAEIARLSVALGADPQTLYGLAGLGDLYVTCASRHSRNRRVGERIGQGETLDAVTASMSAVAEGVTTTRAALELAASVGIELPITEQVAKILFEGIDPRYAIHALMTRQPRSEN